MKNTKRQFLKMTVVSGLFLSAKSLFANELLNEVKRVRVNKGHLCGKMTNVNLRKYY